MQPDAFTFLLSCRREMLLAASQPGQEARAPYLTRGSHALERLAFYQQGLETLLPEIVSHQEALLAKLQLIRGRAEQFSTMPADLVTRYEVNNSRIGEILESLALDQRMIDEAFAKRVDKAFQESSRLSYQLTRQIAERAKEQAEQWEMARAARSARVVTSELLTTYLRRRFPAHPLLRVSDVQKLTGLNANEAFFLRIEGHPEWPRNAILRRSLPAKIQPRSITEEFAILQSLYGGPVPVARPLFCEEDAEVLGEPFIVLERLPGAVLHLPDMGERGKQIYLRLAALMGKLHSLEPELLPRFRRASDSDALGWLHHRINVYEREWRRGASEPVHTVTAAFHWLRRHAGSFLSPQVIVHGDLDHRNTLVGEGDNIVALIDWEVAHQGHPAEDLAYVRDWVEQLMPWSEFVAVYEANGGKKVSEEAMRYGKVLSNLLRVTTSMVAYDAYVQGRLDNFLMGTVRTLEAETACQALHEAIHG